ncbi:ECF RNA polymerase sigma factor SigW [Pontiella desulfatans]|uniref:ECF RNA polymerase sigma factor SigW n=1 Tax=Pontiella desulfatans TaxID=2750659 RepID=A0A6C2U8S1_PONDE|nr:sigma-70 family RNA polymerase sigma factor [Pontiella desulfatans]VGO16355.1 ECF RNA polymerase sigma factor SigW [Pontiella desulfatans]
MNEETKGTYRTRMTLLQKMQKQYDEKAWQEFVDSYSGYIYTIINSMNIASSDADDLRQQIFLKLWKKLPDVDLNKMTRFRSYLAVVVRNCVKDFLRKKQRDTNRSDKLVDSDSELTDSISLPDIDGIIEREWSNYVAALAFKNIAQYFSSDAMKLFDESLKGRDIKVIAEELGMPLSTAYRLKSRVKDSLMDEISALNEYMG